MARQKKEMTEEEQFRKLRLPKREQHEMFAMTVKLHGTNKLSAMCEDGVERMCRIPGKMKKRIWIREGDLLIVKVWDFQPSKADVVWRFKGTEQYHLEKRGLLDKLKEAMGGG
jgi:translation initiation factor 1A